MPSHPLSTDPDPDRTQGVQVAPAELEKFLLLHPIVADASVVPIPSESSGELPRAYIVKSQAFKSGDDKVVKEQLRTYVNEAFAQYKRLDGGIEFVDSLPKTASGKTQRSVVKGMARASFEASKKVTESLQNKAHIVVQVFEFDSDEEDA